MNEVAARLSTQVASPRPITIFSSAMNSSLTDADRADLARFLRVAIEADRWPLSPRVRRLRELPAKIDPTTRAPRVKRIAKAKPRKDKGDAGPH
jgi:hypothetical protein